MIVGKTSERVGPHRDSDWKYVEIVHYVTNITSLT